MPRTSGLPRFSNIECTCFFVNLIFNARCNKQNAVDGNRFRPTTHGSICFHKPNQTNEIIINMPLNNERTKSDEIQLHTYQDV
jgi:hypothetical protein